MKKKLTYKNSGVDVKAADLFVESIQSMVNATPRAGVLKDAGCFASLFQANFGKYKEPVLVSSTDGVGTKLRIAQITGDYSTIGIDLVAMNTNDLIAVGAKPLFFLDYIAVGKVDKKQLKQMVKGIAEGCVQSQCALLGGETAEMPGVYKKEDFDLAGFSVGVVDKKKILSPGKIRRKDKIIGIASSGLHSNGYSLARKIFSEKELKKDKKTVRMLLEPTRIYVKTALSLLNKCNVKFFIHITGGGFQKRVLDFLARQLPPGLGLSVDMSCWQRPKIYDIMQKKSGIKDAELFRTFNMGIGLAVICAPADADKALKVIKKTGFDAWQIGEII